MLEDARDVTRGSVIRADLCVIGAGAAGITIARALAQTGLSIVVAESGGLEAEGDTQALYQGPMSGTPMTSASGDLTLDAIRLRFFGGTTNHWAGWCRPLEPVDFGPTPARPDIGWPFGRETLDPWYQQAGLLCQLGPFEHTFPYWGGQGVNPPLLETDLVTTRVIQVSFPTKFGELYRNDLRRAETVRVLLHANLVRLRTTPDGGTVSAAELATLGGNQLSVEARAFVLATGGIEVPRLLLASNDVRPEGLGNENDLVGRFFMEHIDVGGGFAVLSRPKDELDLYSGRDFPVPPDRVAGRTIQIRGAHILTDRSLQEHELLGIEATLLVASLDEGPVQDDGIRGPDVGALLENLTGTRPPTIAYVRLLAEQSPNPQSRVRLIRDTDPLGVPRVELVWKPTRRDRESMRKGLAIMADELGRAGLGRLQVGVGGIGSNEGPAKNFFELYRVTPADFDRDDFPLSVGFHHMGTARMHSDPKQGVVDPNCKVHSVTNLYVGGSAVFPTTGTSTPTFTIVALALRLADHLRRKVLV